MPATPRLFAALAFSLTACVLLPGTPALAQDTYTEASAPRPLLLKPGTTVINGGVTEAGVSDAFYLKATAGGTLTARLRYAHRNANLLLGLPEQAHLSATISQGEFRSPNSYFLLPGTSETNFTSSFFHQQFLLPERR